MKLGIRVVPDTNIFIAAYKSASPGSPSKAFIDRWQNAEFDLLFSEDTLPEYIEKLIELGVGQLIVNKLIRAIIALGIQVEIIYFHCNYSAPSQSVTGDGPPVTDWLGAGRVVTFHLRYYPEDSDDTAFLLCAVNGDATHIVTQDQHLLPLNYLYSFRICRTNAFLLELQQLNPEQ